MHPAFRRQIAGFRWCDRAGRLWRARRCGQARRNRSVAKALLSHSNLTQGQAMKVYDPHKTTTEVRQASPRLGNFWVLIVSTALVVALFAIIFLVFSANTPANTIN
jgi:hypothetical protein